MTCRILATKYLGQCIVWNQKEVTVLIIQSNALISHQFTGLQSCKYLPTLWRGADPISWCNTESDEYQRGILSSLFSNSGCQLKANIDAMCSVWNKLLSYHRFKSNPAWPMPKTHYRNLPFWANLTLEHTVKCLLHEPLHSRAHLFIKVALNHFIRVGLFYY